jgi:hypothetical protein
MLVPESRHPVARFGGSVALSADGTTALVGAPLESSSETDLAGVAYLFVKNDNEWVQQTRFAPTSIDSGDEFGRAVALSKDGGTAVVGSPGDETSDGVAVGTAYVFTHIDDDWNIHARIIPPAGDTGDRFGTDVDLARDGSIALVGSFAKDAAYICERNEASWVVQQRFSSPENDSRGTFGNSVSLCRNGSTAVVGAPQARSAGKARTGVAHIYVSTSQGWTHQEELKPDKLDGEDFFGASVSINEAGNGVVVGAPLDDESAGSDSGSTHTFVQNNESWDYISQIGGQQANQRDQFGYATAIGVNDTIFVGAVRGNDTNGEKTGTVSIVAPSED